MNNSFLNDVKDKLQAGRDAANHENVLMGYQRASASEARKLDPPPKESAVFFLLFPRKEKIHTLFIQRPDGIAIHSNQLSFPGGKLEAGETSLQGALRETFEEVGINSDAIDILGELSELYIPPSHFVVHPFVGYINHEPVFAANQSEVKALIEVPIIHFFDEKIIREKDIFIPTFDRHIKAKYFDVQGHTLWGATAMMVQEFRMLFGYQD